MSATPDLVRWRAELRTWLTSVLPPRAQATPGCQGDYAVFQNLSDAEEHALLEKIRAYRRQRYDAGYGAIALAAELGGAGLPAQFLVAFTEEENAFATPQSTELISVTTGLVGPTVATYGTDEQRAEYALAFLRADRLVCQLFSEPGAGSDLAAVATAAVQTDDGWVLDGQKVWSSGARYADYGLLLARTDPDVAKQAGLTMFLVPMATSGVEVRPIRQMSGSSSFNEVFLSDVQVPDTLRIGEVGNGWAIANATLAFERTASGQGTRRKGGSVDDLISLAQRLGRSGDPVIRQRLADAYIRTTLRTATTDRVARATAAGVAPGPAASIGKLIASANLTLIGDIAAQLLGSRLTADTGADDWFAWNEHVLGAPGYRLAGGTDEIQRNIIGERVLGLPREPQVERGMPYSQLSRD